MPHLDANALDNDPNGIAFLAAVLEVAVPVELAAPGTERPTPQAAARRAKESAGVRRRKSRAFVPEAA